MQHTMEGSNDVQDSTTVADMCKPVQETGDELSIVLALRMENILVDWLEMARLSPVQAMQNLQS